MADGLARSGFDIDLREGKANEDALVHIFLSARVEVKTDHWAVRSGHVAVEIRQGSPEKGEGQKSGIQVTQAAWWAFHLVGLGWYLIEKERLYALTKRAYAQFGSKMLGDYNRYECVLVPVEWLVRPWKEAA